MLSLLQSNPMHSPNCVGIPNGCASPITISAPNFPGGVNAPNDNGFEETINNDFC